MNQRIGICAIILTLLDATSCSGGKRADRDAQATERDADVGAADAEPLCDEDGDGYTAYFLRFDPRCSSDSGPFDCDDQNDTIYPGADEVCDRKDNDCDGEIDDSEIHRCPLSCAEPSSGCETVRKLVSGDDHFCALLSSGDILCWGNNASGEVADMEQGYFPRPRRLRGISGVRDIEIGGDLSCALLDQRALCWGGGVALPYEVTVGVNVVQIAVDDARLCSLTTSGTVICWSRDESGFVTSALKVYVESGAVALSTYAEQLCALTAIGEVRCWHGDVDYIPILSDATAIDVGPDLGCAVIEGAVSCWEPGEYSTQIEGISDAIDVRVGRHARCALKKDHRLACFHGSAPDSLGPVKTFALADDSGAAASASGEIFSFKGEDITRLSVGLDSEKLPILFSEDGRGRCLDRADLTTLALDSYAASRQRQYIEAKRSCLACESKPDPPACRDACERDNPIEESALSALCDDCFRSFAECALRNPSESAGCYSERSKCIGLPIDFLFPKALGENPFCAQDQCVDRYPVARECSSDMECRSGECQTVPFLESQDTSARICQLPK
ncbi:MAG: hypothetical protein JXA30_14490 [Deltaproteobacteria bacterium]|nr:hypothetical protein [Deltaproteobacteria bacterium]